MDKQISQPFPYIYGENYENIEAIRKLCPPLQCLNEKINWKDKTNIAGLIIRFRGDDNLHKAIKYGIWSSMSQNNKIFHQIFQQNSEVFLFFSALKSGMFEGVARLTSGFNQESFPYWFQDYQQKFKGHFKIQWVYIKDVPYNKLLSIKCKDKELGQTKDGDLLPEDQTKHFLSIFNHYELRSWIFKDFSKLDERQSRYIRPMFAVYEESRKMMQINNY